MLVVKAPRGAWSAATKIGSAADSLESFQVDGGILHATVKANDGLSYYETLDGTAFHRYPISDVAIGPTSMRVGSDGPVDHTSTGTHHLWTWQPRSFSVVPAAVFPNTPTRARDDHKKIKRRMGSENDVRGTKRN